MSCFMNETFKQDVQLDHPFQRVLPSDTVNETAAFGHEESKKPETPRRDRYSEPPLSKPRNEMDDSGKLLAEQIF